MSDEVGHIIDEIDAGRLHPRSHAVTVSLARHFSLSPLGLEILKSFEQGVSISDPALLDRIWNEIKSLPVERQGALRTLVGLLHPDTTLDGYESGFMLSWAKAEGVPNQAIRAAFEGN